MSLEISQNSQENICKFIKKEALAQIFSCELSEISKNTFFTEDLRTTTFVDLSNCNSQMQFIPTYLFTSEAATGNFL